MYSADESKRDPILAAVGQLQFEVVQFRLRNEYGVETTLEPLGYSVARWVVDGWNALEKAGRLFNTLVVKDNWNRPVFIIKNEWNVNQVLQTIPICIWARSLPLLLELNPFLRGCLKSPICYTLGRCNVLTVSLGWRSLTHESGYLSAISVASSIAPT